MNCKISFIIIFLFAVLYGGGLCIAQKHQIDSLDYQNWKLLSSPKISQNGDWIAYRYSYLRPDEQSNNPDFVWIFNTKNHKSIQIIGSQLKFTNNGDWIRYEKTMEDYSSKTVLRNLKTGKEIEWNKPYYFNDDEHSSLLFYSYKPTNEYLGNKLIVYNYITRDSVCYNHILQHQFINNNKELVAIQVVDDKVVLKYFNNNHKETDLFSSDADLLGNFVMNKGQKAGTFLLKEKDESGKLKNRFLYDFTLTGEVKQRIDFDKVPDPLDGFKMEQSCYLTYDMNIIYPYVNSTVRSAYKPPVTNSDDSGVDIWKWNEGAMDRRMAKVRGQQSQTFRPDFAYKIHENQFIQLTENAEERVIKSESVDAEFLFVEDHSKYKVETDWTFEEARDLYVLDLKDGKKYLFEDSIYVSPSWSKTGKVALIWNPGDKCWERIQYKDGKVTRTNLSKYIPYHVFNETYDLPLSVPAYGIAAWVNNDENVVFYDRYDMWMVDVNHPENPVCITHKYGRKHQVQLRFAFSSMNYAFESVKDFAYLKGLNEKTKAKGVFTYSNQKVAKLYQGDFGVTLKSVSENGTGLLFTKESYQNPPELFYGDAGFKQLAQVSDLNPQADQMALGTNRMIRWKDEEGLNHEGVLYLPENYDASKAYPVIVTFYEVSSDERFTFKYPSYAESSINIPTYVSKGYIVFQPDIQYKIGSPLNSAYNAVVSGTKYITEQGIADSKRIAIHGHSFGGTQTASIITKTNLYACAVVASGVTNLTSNYSGLRVNGIANMFMYESGQMRMGKSMFEDTQAYLEASSLLHVDQIQTPVMIFHCDGDKAVPFSEGRALFFGLRRLGKPSWLINYKGEAHELHKLSSQKDWTYRLQSFLDYYLKDSAQPEWMK